MNALDDALKFSEQDRLTQIYRTSTMISEEEILNASILIVDDKSANVELLEQMLRDVGYACITSTMDPHTVCAMHRANRYDLILLDLLMPAWMVIRLWKI